MPSTTLPAAAPGLPEEPKLHEPYVCTPVYADGLAQVEIAPTGNARMTLYVEQRDAYEGRLERVIAARVVIPQAALAEAAGRIMAALSAASDAPSWASHMEGRA